MTNKDVYEAADVLLKALDKAPLGKGTIFKDQTAKDWMETSVHRALAKLDAAAYHCSNVGRLVEGAHEKAKKALSDHSRSVHDLRVKNLKTRTSGTVAVQEIAYEIDAFLAASRASVDFSANIIALHLGMTRRTGVTSVLGWLDKNPCPPFAFVIEGRAWIENLKAYRDECVHFRTLRAQVGFEAERTKGVTAKATMPFFVAENITPANDRPDTRARRAFEFALGDDFLPEGFSRIETRGSFTADDGTELQFEHTIRYDPPPGYVLAEEFCSRHLDKLREFTASVFEKAPTPGFALQRRTTNTIS